MAISQGLSAHISNLFSDAGVATEMQNAVANASNIAGAARIATGSTSLSPANDYRVLMNATSGSNAVSLPAGVNGQTFALAYHPSNTSTWTLTPNGSDTLASNVSSKMSASTPQNVQYLNGQWYSV
jgi:hypothetical protein